MKLNNISKKYNDNKGNQSILALDNIDLNIPNKGFLLITGESGSGKSTLLHIIGQIERSTSGFITENEIFNKENISYIFQDFNLIEGLNVLDNIKLGYSNFKTIDNEKSIDVILDYLDIYKYKYKKVSNLSKGQKQRVAIARALINESTLIIADEPTASLDKKNAKLIFSILKEISKSILVIVSSHDIELAKDFTDYTLTLKNGSVQSYIQNKAFEYQEPKLEKDKKIFNLGLFFRTAYSKILNKFLIQNMILAVLIVGLSFFTMYLLASIRYNPFNKSIDQMIVDGNTYVNITFFDENHHNKYMTLDEIESYSPLSYMSQILPISNYTFDLGYNINNQPLATSLVKAIGISNSFLEDSNYKILSGRLPNAINEIAITKLQFEIFKLYGILLDDNVIEINTYDDIIGLHINYINGSSNEKLFITGIIDTGYDTSKYIYEMDERIKQNQFVNLIDTYSIHNTVFVSSKYFSLYDKQINQHKINDVNYDFDITFYADYKNKLVQNELIISHTIAQSLGITQKTTADYRNSHVDKVILEYAETYFDEIKDIFESDIEQNKWWLLGMNFKDPISFEDYATYIKESVYGGLNNYYDETMQKEDIDLIVDKTFNKMIPLNETVVIGLISNNKVDQYTVKYIDLDLNNYMSTDDFMTHIDISNDSYDQIIVIDNQKEKLLSLLDLKLENNFEFKNEYLHQAYLYDEDLNYYQVQFPNLYKYALVLVISIFLLLNFTMVNFKLKNRLKEIGLLKTLNYTYSSIYLTMLIESISILVIFSSVGIFISNKVLTDLNKAVNLKFYLLESPLENNFNDIFLMFGIISVILISAISISILNLKKRTLSSIIREF